jgi:hypothetical protein
MMLGLSVWADRLRVFMKLKLDRIISIATLVALVVAIVLLLKKPAPVAQPAQSPAGVAANAQSSNQKVDELEPAAKQAQQTQPSQASGGYFAASQPSQSSQAPQSSKAETHGNSDELSAAISKVLSASAGGAAGLSPDSEVGSGEPNIKDQQVTYEGDVVHGRFLTEIAGKDVWVTISGHMGEKDGYATFDPTEFKVGDLNVPVSLVNPALQRKLAEERERLKLQN